MCFQIKTLKVHSQSKKLARITKNRNIDFFCSFFFLINELKQDIQILATQKK